MIVPRLKPTYVKLAGGTFHSAAAAATSMARAVAPALRNCIQELAMAELPPVPCIVPKTRLAYLLASAGADSTRERSKVG